LRDTRVTKAVRMLRILTQNVCWQDLNNNEYVAIKGMLVYIDLVSSVALIGGLHVVVDATDHAALSHFN
jgi:hypothetical protein